jgi:general L-amino acid transport system substrate-binding protein
MRKLSITAWIGFATLIALHGPSEAGSTLDGIRSRGYIQCGANTNQPGFSQIDQTGQWHGLDVDTCKAVAAAILGDATKEKFTPLTAQQRFAALQSGEIDLLARDTTWTLTRDAALGLAFTVTTFYDGQGFMVRKESGVKHLNELSGATICVQQGSSIEGNLADYFRAHNLDFKPLVVDTTEAVVQTFFAGRCDAMSSDTAPLAGQRATMAKIADEFLILPEVINKEPLAPAVRRGDDEFFAIVRWAIFAAISAEEKGITSTNVDSFLASTDPEVKRLLGVVPGMGKALGIDEKWAYNLIKQVGNYGEIFDRNLGKESPMKLPRGMNALARDGGLIYAPPIN